MSRIGILAAAALCLALYVPIAVGILSSGNNPDDWRFLAGRAIDFAEQGRWATDIAHNILLGGQFLTGLHVVMVLVALGTVSVLIAWRAVPRGWVPVASVVAFLAGAHHAYLTDILHYQSLAGWFSLALACSVAGLALIYPGDSQRRWLQTGLLHLAAVQLVALSMGLYQSFALLGLLLPAVALLRIDAVPDRQALWYCARGAAVFVAGAILYTLELKLVLMLMEQEAQPRFSGSSLNAALGKLPGYPGLMYRLLGGANVGLVGPYRPLLLLGSLVAIGLALVAAAGAARDGSSLRGRRDIAALRCLAGGAGAVALLPGIFWFAYPESFLPGRAAGFIGFVVAGVMLASATAVGAAWRRGRAGMLPFGLSAAALYGFVGLLASHQIWSIVGETSERDIALARAIETQAREDYGDDLPPEPIRLVGGVEYVDLRFGWFLPPSSLHPGIDQTSIFEVLHAAEGPSGSMPVSPRPCPAFPETGSLFVSDGALHVCLEARGAFPEFDSCAAIDRIGAQVCFAADLTAIRAPSCDAIAPEDGLIEVQVRGDGSSGFETIQFHSQAQAFPIGDWCYRFAGPAQQARDRIVVSQLGVTADTRWSEDL